MLTHNHFRLPGLPMKIGSTPLATALLAGALVSPAMAGEKEELLKLKNTTINLIDILVQQGVLDKKKAQDLIKSAEDKAAAEAKQQLADEAAEQKAAAPKGGKELAADEAGKGKANKSVRVAYVPEFVKDEIRQQVRAELRDDVVKDVKAQAKEEKWGVPAALPSWISRIEPYGDIRVRWQDDFFDKNNYPFYLNYLQINQAGGFNQAQARFNQAYLNTTQSFNRFRERFRIGFDAQISSGVKAGLRLATSNQFSPVSNDQNLGNTGQSYQVALDRAFLQYDFVDSKGNDWFTLYAGRYANPFVSTDVVFDPDLSFEGLASTFRLNLGQDDPFVKSYHTPNPVGRTGVNLGSQHPNSVFATFGMFPIQSVNFSSVSKWMYGSQVGADWLVFNESRMQVAASYYDYENIRARRNSLNSLTYDWTAPQFIQKGNSMVPIDDSANQTNCGSTSSPNTCLYGLASNFRIFNATAMFDYTGFAPLHIMLTGDYAKNLGFDQARIFREFGQQITPKTNAYQVRLDIGRTAIRRVHDWSMNLAYRYIERDAVLDAFTDSQFHQGGTDAKGWVAGLHYGLANDTWLSLNWYSTNSISNPPLKIDTLMADLTARF